MTALSADRNTPKRESKLARYPVLTATEIFAGSMVVLDSSGYAKPGVTGTGLVCVGRANEYVNNEGASGAKYVEVEEGCFRWANGESFTIAHIGDTCYILDDQTVYRTATGKSPAGVVKDVDSDGVWVDTGKAALATTGLTAANNLSDLGTLATAQSNLGLTDGSLAARFEDVTVDDDCLISGIVTGLRKTQAIAANAYTVVSADDGDIVIASAADNDVVTLPDAAAANLGMRITVQNRGADGAHKLSVSPHSSDKIFGGIHGGAGGDLVSFAEGADKDIINTKATAKKGDYVVLVSDGSTGWWVIGGKGVWASEA